MYPPDTHSRSLHSFTFIQLNTFTRALKLNNVNKTLLTLIILFRTLWPHLKCWHCWPYCELIKNEDFLTPVKYLAISKEQYIWVWHSTAQAEVTDTLVLSQVSYRNEIIESYRLWRLRWNISEQSFILKCLFFFDD